VSIFKVQALTSQVPVIKPAQRNSTQKQNTKQIKQKQYSTEKQDK
jgi:hypothetical protein